MKENSNGAELTFPMGTTRIQVISLERTADIIESGKITNTIDRPDMTINLVDHPKLGEVTLISTPANEVIMVAA